MQVTLSRVRSLMCICCGFVFVVKCHGLCRLRWKNAASTSFICRAACEIAKLFKSLEVEDNGGSSINSVR